MNKFFRADAHDFGLIFSFKLSYSVLPSVHATFPLMRKLLNTTSRTLTPKPALKSLERTLILVAAP